MTGLIAEICCAVQDAQSALETYATARYFDELGDTSEHGVIKPRSVHVKPTPAICVNVPLCTLLPHNALHLHDVQIQMAAAFRVDDDMLIKTGGQSAVKALKLTVKRQKAAEGVAKLTQQTAAVF